MKKIISILLLIVTTFSLSACNKSNNTSSQLVAGSQSDVSSMDILSQSTTTSTEVSESTPSTNTTPSNTTPSNNTPSNSTPSKIEEPKPTVVAGEYTVTFDYGYDNIKTTAKSKNYKVAKPEDPKRSGYKFMGWYAANESEQWNFTGHAVTTDMTLTARWSKYSYYISYSNVLDGVTTRILKKSEVRGNASTSKPSFDTTSTESKEPEKGKVVIFETYSAAIKEDAGFINGERTESSISFPSDEYEKYVFRVPNSFSVDTATFTIQELNIAGYTFLGWTYDGQTTPVKTVTIPKGTTKDYNIIANWKSK